MRALGFILTMLLAFAARAGEAPLRLIQTIPLEDGRGRIDHMALDPARQRLFVAELGNDSVAVVDLRAAKMSRRLTGVAEPQGIAYVPGLDRLFVTSGETGSVAVFEGAKLARAKEIALDSDADNIRYDPTEQELYVGFGNGALGRIAPAGEAHVNDIALSGHPESFQLQSKGPMIFVNVPDAGDIEIVDRNQGAKIASWPLAGTRANFPMALDEEGHRLIVATREPAALIVLDTQTGKELARIEVCGDADDVFYDARRRQLYVSCGDGTLDVLALPQATPPTRAAKLTTAVGARTSLFAPAQDRLYVAVPHRGGQPAEILVYQPTS
jgi:DNA-binding beta-propeller fold protein YncE